MCDENFEIAPFSRFECEFCFKICESGKDKIYFYCDKKKVFYAGMKYPLTYEVSYVKNPSLPKNLAVRVYWVILSKLHEPLSRSLCSSKDHKKDTTQPVNHIVVLGQHGPAEYVGTPDGISPKDRLALEIPMGDSSRKIFLLQFMCLSSCGNASKSPTGLVSDLVDPVSGQIFARQMIPIQVTANYKRDIINKGKRKQADTSIKDDSGTFSLTFNPKPCDAPMILDVFKKAIKDEITKVGGDETKRAKWEECLAEVESKAADLERH